MFARICMVVALAGMVAVCSGRGKLGQSQMGATFEVLSPGDKGCPITTEVAGNLEKCFGQRVVIAVVKVDNRNGIGDYVSYVSEARAEAGDAIGLTPVESEGQAWDGDIPSNVSKLFRIMLVVDRGSNGVFAIAFHAPSRGNMRLKSVTLRTGLTDEQVNCN